MADRQSNINSETMTWENALAALNPEPIFVEQFREPVRLTPEGQEPALFAVGRSREDLLVESRFSDGATFGPRPLASFSFHSPDVFASLDMKSLRPVYK